MSANTRQDDDRQLAQLARLFTGAVQFIEAGKRHPQQVRELERALQAFKENKLTGVMVGAPTGTTLSKNELQALLDQKVGNLTISPRARQYFAERGVVHLGEVLGIHWDRRLPSRSEMEMYFDRFGISIHSNALELGWVPPYFGEEAFLNLLNIYFNDVTREEWSFQLQKTIKVVPYGMYSDDYLYLGQAFQWARSASGTMNKGDNSRLADLHYALKEHTQVHAGMLVPSEWKAPDAIPEQYAKDVAQSNERYGHRIRNERHRAAIVYGRQLLGLPPLAEWQLKL